jgi:hypothetical protein
MHFHFLAHSMIWEVAQLMYPPIPLPLPLPFSLQLTKESLAIRISTYAEFPFLQRQLSPRDAFPRAISLNCGSLDPNHPPPHGIHPDAGQRGNPMLDSTSKE